MTHLDLIKRAAHVLAESSDQSPAIRHLRVHLVEAIKVADPQHYGLQPAPRPLRAVIGRGTFTVEGRGEFPVDMLRYDQCTFASPADEAEAGQGYVGGHRRRVTLTSEKRAATIGRWDSFGW